LEVKVAGSLVTVGAVHGVGLLRVTRRGLVWAVRLAVIVGHNQKSWTIIVT
jgi:hypothetical protein